MSDRPTILPPNSTGLELSVEQAVARVEDLETRITRLWSPQDCPAELLPWLAWALSVDYWGDGWSEDLRRAVCAASVETHRRKGTVGAVRRALAAAGVNVEIVEWWQTGGAPHTFEVTALARDILSLGVTLGPELATLVRRAVDPVKPVRSHYAIKVGESFGNDMDLRTGTRVHRRHDLAVAPLLPPHGFIAAAAPRLGSRVTHRLSLVAAPNLPRTRFSLPIEARAGVRLSRRDAATLVFTNMRSS